jgi:hypothetical protein
MSLNNSIVTQSVGVPYQQYVTSSAGHTLVSSSTYFNDTSDNIPRYKDASGNIYDAIISSSYALTASHALNSGGDAFPFTGDAQITGSLIVSSSGITSIGNITASNEVLIGYELNIGDAPYNASYAGRLNMFDSAAKPTFELIPNLNSVQQTANMTMYGGNNNPQVFLVAGSGRLNYIGGGLSIGNSNTMDRTNTNATGDAKLYVNGNAQITGSLTISGSTTISTGSLTLGTGSLSVTGSVSFQASSGGTIFSIGPTGSFTLGEGANSNNIDTAVAIGYNATANSSYDVSIGGNSNASGGNSVAIGRSANAGANGIAIGLASAGANGVAMGQSSAATGNGVSIGYDSETPAQSISIGSNAKSSGANSITLNANGSATSTSTANALKVFITSNSTPDFEMTNTHITASGNISGSAVSTASFGTYLGNGSNLTGIAASTATTASYVETPEYTTRWDVTNNGSSAYRFAGNGVGASDDNPDIYLTRGEKYLFNLNASGHPFQIRVSSGGSAYSDGVTNNTAEVGDIIFEVPFDSPNHLYYQCTNHGSMIGRIQIVGSFISSSFDMLSPDGTIFRFTVNNSGHLSVTGSSV